MFIQHDVDWWRDLSNEIRRSAEEVPEPSVKTLMLGVALSCEQVAKRLQDIVDRLSVPP